MLICQLYVALRLYALGWYSRCFFVTLNSPNITAVHWVNRHWNFARPERSTNNNCKQVWKYARAPRHRRVQFSNRQRRWHVVGLPIIMSAILVRYVNFVFFLFPVLAQGCDKPCHLKVRLCHPKGHPVFRTILTISLSPQVKTVTGYLCWIGYIYICKALRWWDIFYRFLFIDSEFFQQLSCKIVIP